MDHPTMPDAPRPCGLVPVSMVEPLVGETASKGPDELKDALEFGRLSKFCKYVAPVKLSSETDSIVRCSSNSTRGLNPDPNQLLHCAADRCRLDFCDRWKNRENVRNMRCILQEKSLPREQQHRAARGEGQKPLTWYNMTGGTPGKSGSKDLL